MDKLYKLEDLPNISTKLASLLREIGINSPVELLNAGTLQTFERLKAVEPDACFSKLCAIQGAIDGIRWHNLTPAKKEELRQWFQLLKKTNP
jgi:DNA transformation protein